MKACILSLIVILATFVAGGVAQAAKTLDGTLHIAVVTDMSGPFSDVAGQGAVIAAELAVDDFRAESGRSDILLSTVDHHNSPAEAVSAVQSLNRKHPLDALVELSGSGIPSAMQQLAEQLDLITLYTGAASPNQVQGGCRDAAMYWGYDAFALGSVISRQIFGNGWQLWTLFTPDGDLGKSYQSDLNRRIKSSGGFAQESVTYPLGSKDISGPLMEAFASDTEAVAIAAGGADLRTVIRQSYELGLTHAEKGLAIINMSIYDVHSLGLYVTSGLEFAVPFYWNADARARAFSDHFRQRDGQVPSGTDAAVYSAVLHLLRAYAAADSERTSAIAAQMRKMPVDDFYARGGKIRADGRLMHPMYRVRVKRPRDSKTSWDYLQILDTIPADAAFEPISGQGCGRS